jgi:hypothetical protein
VVAPKQVPLRKIKVRNIDETKITNDDLKVSPRILSPL